jgi:periplasmic protein CpxP/Spy
MARIPSNLLQMNIFPISIHLTFNKMNNQGFLKGVIIVLVLINIGMLAFMWYNRPISGSAVRRSFAPGFLVKELELSKSQQKDYFRLRRNHRQILGQLQERDKALHTRFFDQLFSEIPDSKSVAALADSIAQNRREMEVLTYDHFEQVREMLTPVQQKKFRDVFDDVLRIVLPPPPLPPSPETPPSPPPPPPLPAPKK